jgi:hypothetical protein
LALHAGGDLGLMARWRVTRHLAHCRRCREELAAFTAAREIIAGLAEVPELPWSRLEAEMKANIRLGLAAGECVRVEAAADSRGWMGGMRTVVACATAVILVVTGLILERPQPRVPQASDVVMEKTADGIQISDGREALGLTNPGARDVIYSVSAQGMGARYVDPKTGYVTVNNLYAQ